METPQWINDFFNAIDSGDASGFVQYLTEDASFRMGNAEPMLGKKTVLAGVSMFISSLKGMKHNISHTSISGDVIAIHGSVTYTRLDDTELSVPFANILYMAGNKIKDYLVFINNSEL